jgi:DNA mismatch repair ATPase MutL
MDISKLTKGSIRGVLHEAESKYGLPNFDDEDEKKDQNNDQQQDDNAPDQNTDNNENNNNNNNSIISSGEDDNGSTSSYSLGNYEENNEPDDDNNNDVPDETNEDEQDNQSNGDIIDEGDDSPNGDPNGNYDPNGEEDDSDGEDQYDEDDNTDPEEDSSDNPDDSDDPDKTPGLKILGLSDEDNKINNGRLLGQFRDLFKKVNDTLNNNIINVTTKNAKQKQVVDIVYNNLSSMLSDLDAYIMHKYQETYEDNMLVYLTYIKRYRIAMSLIRLVIDENKESSESEK